MKKVDFVKSVRLIRDDSVKELIAIKAFGTTELKNLISPVLIRSKDYQNPPDDGIYELDFVLDNPGQDYQTMEMEVNIVFKVKSLPSWVKGFKICGKENSDIVLI